MAQEEERIAELRKEFEKVTGHYPDYCLPFKALVVSTSARDKFLEKTGRWSVDTKYVSFHGNRVLTTTQHHQAHHDYVAEDQALLAAFEQAKAKVDLLGSLFPGIVGLGQAVEDLRDKAAEKMGDTPIPEKPTRQAVVYLQRQLDLLYEANNLIQQDLQDGAMPADTRYKFMDLMDSYAHTINEIVKTLARLEG